MQFREKPVGAQCNDDECHTAFSCFEALTRSLSLETVVNRGKNSRNSRYEIGQEYDIRGCFAAAIFLPINHKFQVKLAAETLSCLTAESKNRSRTKIQWLQYFITSSNC